MYFDGINGDLIQFRHSNAFADLCMMARQRKLYFGLVALLGAYFLAAVVLEFKVPGAEIFPVFSWSLFANWWL